MKNVHITIGIPAYNEGRNIQRLLKSLEKQYLWGIVLDAIIVVSDGSTDDTVQQIRSVKNTKIKYIHHSKRQGINSTLNELFTLSRSSILILLNADVDIANKAFLHKLIYPFRTIPNLGIVGANVLPLRPNKYFEKILAISHMLKKHIYDHTIHGHNIYNCHGRGRAISKTLYSQIIIPEDVPEDAYIYLSCLSLEYSFHYQPEAIVKFRSPQNFLDHVKQSVRFSQGKTSLYHYFDANIIEQEYNIASLQFIKSTIIYILKNPIEILGYIIIQSFIQLKYKHIIINQTLFDPSNSSKGLV